MVIITGVQVGAPLSCPITTRWKREESMAWNFLTVVDADHDDPALYPVMSDQSSSMPVALDEYDGNNPVLLTCSKIKIGHYHGTAEPKTDQEIELDLQVVITDARVIVYCEKYDKGGGWVGFGGAGLAFSLAANAVSKARAASRRRGKLLVGHVRYPWLGRVAASPKIDWRTRDLLRLTVPAQASPLRVLGLTLTLPKGTDAAETAAEIARRAARYRLAHTDIPEEKLAAVHAATEATRQVPSGQYHGLNQIYAEHVLPTGFCVEARTAYEVRQPRATPDGSSA
jgi:hypothetical protein